MKLIDVDYVMNRLREPTTYLGAMLLLEAVGKGYPDIAPYVDSAKIVLGGVAMMIKEVGSTDAPTAVSQPTA